MNYYLYTNFGKILEKNIYFKNYIKKFGKKILEKKYTLKIIQKNFNKKTYLMTHIFSF